MKILVPLLFATLLFSGCTKQLQQSSDRFIRNYTQGPQEEVNKKIEEVQHLKELSEQYQQKSADY